MTLSPLSVFLLLAIPLAAAFGIDLWRGDPPEGTRRERYYPPVLVGRMGQWWDRQVRRGDPGHERRMGVIGWLLVILPPILLSLLLLRALVPIGSTSGGLLGAPGPLFTALPGPREVVALGGLFLYFVLVALWVKSLFTVRGLIVYTHRALDASGDARRRAVSAVVNRPTEGLEDPLLLSAMVETSVENATDSVVAPFLAYALVGLPGLVAYRTINTLDALWGHPEGPYRHFGWFAARVDHYVNLFPDMFTALALGLLGGAWSQPPPRLEMNEGGSTPPHTIRMAARILGVRLEKRGSYVLGADRRAPREGDVRRTLRLVQATSFLALGISLAIMGGLAYVGWAYGI